MKKKATALLSCAFALCFTLVLAGCSGGGSADTSKNFIGTWELSGLSSNGEETTAEELQMMKALGLEVKLYLCEDKTATFLLFDEQISGTWEAKDASTATVTLEGDSAEATLEDGTLVIGIDGDTMSFTKSSDTAVVPDASSSGTTDSSTSSDTTTTEAVEEVLVDDEFCTITFLGAEADFAGDPGFNLRIQNKTDATFVVSTEYDSFSVNGKMCDPVLYETIKPGKYADAFMWFNSDDVPDGLDGLKGVEGTIILEDESTYDVIASYNFGY